MTCPRCFYQAAQGEKFCFICGMALNAPAPKAFCPMCRATLIEGSKFCGACGAAIAHPPQAVPPAFAPPPNQAPPPDSSQWLPPPGTPVPPQIPPGWRAAPATPPPPDTYPQWAPPPPPPEHAEFQHTPHPKGIVWLVILAILVMASIFSVFFWVRNFDDIADSWMHLGQPAESSAQNGDALPVIAVVDDDDPDSNGEDEDDEIDPEFLLTGFSREATTISGGAMHTAGLMPDGTVIVTSIIYDDYDIGQSDVSDWSGIIAIAAGEANTIGLRADGTVVATAITDNEFDAGQSEVSDWSDIVAISGGWVHTVGLRSDGTVVATAIIDDYDYDVGQSNVSGWSNIVAISAGFDHTVGLRSDGTVVTTMITESVFNIGQTDVSGWSDIVAISAGDAHTVGLRSDGTVVATSITDAWLDYGQSDVSGWSDIVAISAGVYHTVGLRADGTVVAVGSNFDNQLNVSGWSDIVAISAGSWHTVGLRADGTVVATRTTASGWYGGQSGVEDWRDIKIPSGAQAFISMHISAQLLHPMGIIGLGMTCCEIDMILDTAPDNIIPMTIGQLADYTSPEIDLVILFDLDDRAIRITAFGPGSTYNGVSVGMDYGQVRQITGERVFETVVPGSSLPAIGLFFGEHGEPLGPSDRNVSHSIIYEFEDGVVERIIIEFE